MTRLPDPKVSTHAYKETKDLILQLVEHKADFSGPVPMDCGMVDESDAKQENHQTESIPEDLNWMGSKGGKGGKQGGGKGFQGECWQCGEVGHKGHQCPSIY